MPPTLMSLPLEIQEMIILALHPSATIGLSGTNQHFRALCSVEHLNPIVVQDYFRQVNFAMIKRPDFLCVCCLCAKPPSEFSTRSLTGPKRKEGQSAGYRKCLECVIGELRPGQEVNIGLEKKKNGRRMRMVVCKECFAFKDAWCKYCRCCWWCIQQIEHQRNQNRDNNEYIPEPRQSATCWWKHSWTGKLPEEATGWLGHEWGSQQFVRNQIRLRLENKYDQDSMKGVERAKPDRFSARADEAESGDQITLVREGRWIWGGWNTVDD